MIMAFTDLRGKKWLRLFWQAILIGYLGLISGDLISLALLGGWATPSARARLTAGASAPGPSDSAAMAIR